MSRTTWDHNSLFFAHDTLGVPLPIAMIILKGEQLPPNLALFFLDAMVAGWHPDKTIGMIEAACRDNEHPFDEDEFRFKLGLLGYKVGSYDWGKMAEYLRGVTTNESPRDSD